MLKSTSIAVFTAVVIVCAGVSSALAGDPRPATDLSSSEKADTLLNILILGGTGFIGPHMVEYATARGHNVTLFNRGKTNTHLFPNVTKLVGDRDDSKGGA